MCLWILFYNASMNIHNKVCCFMFIWVENPLDLSTITKCSVSTYQAVWFPVAHRITERERQALQDGKSMLQKIFKNQQQKHELLYALLMWFYSLSEESFVANSCLNLCNTFSFVQKVTFLQVTHVVILAVRFSTREQTTIYFVQERLG